MSTRAQIHVAQLMGHAERCVRLEAPWDEAVDSLREITANPGLLAEAAGTLAGAADKRIYEYDRRINAARLLVAAGADRKRLAYWVGVGRRNALRPRGPGVRLAWPDDLDQVLADVVGDE